MQHTKAIIRNISKRRLVGSLAVLVAIFVLALGSTNLTKTRLADAAPLPAGTYCGDTAPTDGSYQGPKKIIVIEGENEPYHAALDPAQAPFQASTLNSQCGYMSNMHNETHGSESNYHALVSGQYANWALCDFPPDDNGAHACPYGPVTDYGNTPSIMSQLESTSGASSWKIYAESMAHLSNGTSGTLVPTNCQKFDGPASSPYAVRHNPGPYFPNISCATQDVPYTAIDGDISSGQLPNFGMIVPDDNDNGHDTGVGNYDSFVASSMAKLQASPDYQSGNLVVVVTYDEGTAHGTDNGTVGEDCTNHAQGDTMGSCQIDSWVVGRYVPHTSWSQFATHYTMLKSAESMLGLSYLGHAADANTVDFYKDSNPFNLNPNFSTTATVPGAPTSVTATAGDGSASVAFTPPTSNGGAAITGYTVTASPGGLTANGGGSPITISGLTDGTAYTFTVTAANSAGTGSASATSDSVTPTATTQTNLLTNGGFESGLTGITAYSTNSTLAQVTSPVHGGSQALKVGSSNSTVTAGFNAAPISGTSITAGENLTASCWVYTTSANYKAHVKLSEGTTFISIADVTSATLPLNTWTLITANATVQKAGDQIVLSGYTNNQTSSTSLVWDDCAVTTTTTPPTVTAPGAPTGVSATAGNGGASVAFTPPTSNGGAAITGYTVTSSPGNITASGTTSPITMSGLTNGTVYTFTVTATNSAGTGVSSAASNSVTPITMPGAPTTLTAMPGNGQVGLSWTAPTSNGGAAITDYAVQYSLSGANSWTTFNDGVSATTSATVTGLTNGTSYDFRVSAVSAAGQGSPSTTVTVIPNAAQVNLLTNGNFETITPANGSTPAVPTGVKTYASSSILTAITSPIHGGSYALQVGSSSAVTAGFNTPPIPGSAITAGKTLSASCWVYAPSNVFKAHLKLSEGTSFVNLIDTTSAALSANTWTLVTASAPAQKTGDQILLSGYTNNQTAGAAGLVWDDCTVTSN